MNLPTEVAPLEAELNRVLGMYEEDEKRLAQSTTPEIDRIFFGSTKKLRHELEKRLHRAKAERRYEVISLRLGGNQLAEGGMPLRLLAKCSEYLNAAIEQSAWRVWDKQGDAARIAPEFTRQLDLQLAEIGIGSTRLAIVGNTAPDLTGISALETAFRGIFDVLGADIDALTDRVHAIGIRAGKSLCDLLRLFERQNIAADLTWRAPDRAYRWQGNAPEITRVRTLLDDIGEPTTTTESFRARVNVLSIRNRMEVERLDTGEKVHLSYHRSLANAVQELRLARECSLVVETTIYPFAASRRKRNAYRLLELEQARPGDRQVDLASGDDSRTPY